jgi:hypothetical protein
MPAKEVTVTANWRLIPPNCDECRDSGECCEHCGIINPNCNVENCPVCGDMDALELAEALTKQVLANFKGRHMYEEADVVNAIKAVLNVPKTNDVIVTMEDFKLTIATWTTTGSITGTIKLSLDDESETVQVNIPLYLVPGDIIGSGTPGTNDLLTLRLILGGDTAFADPNNLPHGINLHAANLWWCTAFGAAGHDTLDFTDLFVLRMLLADLLSEDQVPIGPYANTRP